MSLRSVYFKYLDVTNRPFTEVRDIQTRAKEPGSDGDKPRRYFLDKGSSVGAEFISARKGLNPPGGSDAGGSIKSQFRNQYLSTQLSLSLPAAGLVT